jgi:hypothetical protein
MISVEGLMNNFLDKFKNILTDNFQRGFNLVKNLEKSSEGSGTFSKDNIVKIVQHLLNYIKNMSNSFVDLNEEFDPQIILNDPFIEKLSNTFCTLFLENYFNNIFEKIQYCLNNLENETNVEKNDVYKFYFFYFILLQMNEVFSFFLNCSKVNYLINENIHQTLKNALIKYMNSFYSIFMKRISKEIKLIAVNKGDFTYL